MCCVYYTVKENVEKNQSMGAIRAIGSLYNLSGSGRCVYHIFKKNVYSKKMLKKEIKGGNRGSRQSIFDTFPTFVFTIQGYKDLG